MRTEPLRQSRVCTIDIGHDPSSAGAHHRLDLTDASQNRSEQVPRYGHLGHLKRHVAGVLYHLGTDLDELVPQGSQRPEKGQKLES